MNIAIVSTNEAYHWAGTEEVWFQFASFALQQGHNVALLANNKVASHERVDELKKSGLTVFIRKPFKPYKIYLLKERICSDYKGFDQFDAQVLLINSGSLYDVTNLPYIFQFVNLQTHIPKVFFCHFVSELYKEPISEEVSRLFKSIQKFVFVSKENLRIAQRQLAQKIDSAEVIMNQSKFFLNTPLDWPEQEVIQFACVARFETLWKGHDILLEVLSSDKWKQRNWHLNLFGEGPDKEYIKKLIAYYCLESRITIHGYVVDISSIWSKCQLNVMPSRGEGTPLAVIEAMMCGRPSVVTDVGGNSEILVSNKTGWVAEAATVALFDNALEEAWINKVNWLNMGVNAHKKAQELHQSNAPLNLLNVLKSSVSKNEN